MRMRSTLRGHHHHHPFRSSASALCGLVLLGALASSCAAQGAGSAKEPIGESTTRPRSASANAASTTSSSPTTNTPSDKNSKTPGGETLEQRAAALHRRAIIVDGHNDIPSVIYGTGIDIADKSAWTHTDLARMKAGGITGEFFSIYVEGELAEKPTVIGGGALRRAIDLIDLTYRQVERHPNEMMIATSSADIRRAKRDGKIGVLMGVEGGHAIENSLSALRVLHRLGCRYMTLTHSNTNEWADSAGFSGPPPVRHHGLTPFGEEVVTEMQRIGMLVDISHTSDETFFAVMKIAQAPVIASHSSSRAIADHRRNMTDDMLRALAKNGGVAMVNFWSLFVSNEYGAAAKEWFAQNGKTFAELRAKYKDNWIGFKEALDKLKKESKPQLPKVPLSLLIDHIDHMVQVAGIDHVGLGSDFDGVDSLPEGLDGIDALPKITTELLRRGYKDEDVLKILGENFLRAFEKAEAYSKSKGTRLSGDGSTTRIDRPNR